MIDINSPGEDPITRNSSSTLNPIYTDVLPPSFVTATTVVSPLAEAAICAVLLILGSCLTAE